MDGLHVQHSDGDRDAAEAARRRRGPRRPLDVSRVAYAGTKSVTCYGEAACEGDTAPRVTGMATFVTMDKKGKTYEHWLSLPAEYIAENRAIYEKARAEREPARG